MTTRIERPDVAVIVLTRNAGRLWPEWLKDTFSDNLLSCFAGLQALLNAEPEHTCVLVCTDHEEVGTGNAGGVHVAHSPNIARGAPAGRNHEERSRSMRVCKSSMSSR